MFGGLVGVSVIDGSLPASASTLVTLYVAPSGTGDCSAATPCGSIQQAINTAEGSTYNGDDVTIDAAGGTYTENDSISASSLDLLTIAGGTSTTTVNGGGVSSVFTVNSGTVTLSGLTVTKGSDDRGGGIYNSGTLSINSSTVSGNSAPGGLGGGIYNSGTLTIDSSTVSGNTASLGGLGGGIENNGGTLTINSSTVSANPATLGGGISSSGALTINSSTVSSNTASLGGGISNTGTATIGASILAGNTGSYGSPSCYGGSFTSLGYNLTDDSTGAECGFTQPTDQAGVNPDLGPLAFNGGPTETQLPVASSPAVGVIPPNTTLGGVQVCPRTDQRGVASSGSCAIGAVEANTVTVTDPGNQTNTSGLAITPLTNSATDSEPGAALTWSATGLPVGLSIDPGTGTITGTPTATCTCSVTLTATDAAGYDGATAFTWIVNSAGPQVIITTTSLPDATLGQPYSFQLQATGGTPPYTWNKYGRVGMGALPVGVGLARSGLISGTPKRADTYTIVVKCLDSGHSHKTQGTQKLTLTINP
jgi:hypothetical protein